MKNSVMFFKTIITTQKNVNIVAEKKATINNTAMHMPNAMTLTFFIDTIIKSVVHFSPSVSFRAVEKLVDGRSSNSLTDGVICN